MAGSWSPPWPANNDSDPLSASIPSTIPYNWKNDPFSAKGLAGMYARGKNVYLGGLPSAPHAGRPRKPAPTFGQMNPEMLAAIQRRLAGGRKSA